MPLTSPGSCDEDTKKANRETAKRRTPVRNYGQARVEVTASDSQTKKFSFKATGTDGAEHEFKDHDWAVEKNMWVCCPSSLSSTCNDPNQEEENKKHPPAIGAIGILYVEKDWAAQINLAHSAPKWPGNLPLNDPPYAEMKVLPDCLILTGSELDDGLGTVASIDLTDPAYADVRQTIVVNQDGMTVRVSQTAFGKFGLGWAGNVAFATQLAQAVETIQSSPSDAATMARAWGMVANAVARIRESGQPMPEEKALVLQVLPEIVL